MARAGFGSVLNIDVSNVFDDSEGDPVVVGTSAAADGTSTYAARRDHKHQIDTTELDARYLQISNNLSDLANAATARTNLGLVAGGAGDIWAEKAGDTMTGDLILNDSVSLLLGTGSDGELFHDGSNTYFQNNTGGIIIENEASDGDITFKVNDGGVDTTVMTIDGATGNVGIGTTGPQYKLSFGSAGDKIGYYASGSYWSTITPYDATSGAMIFNQNFIGNAGFRFQDDGSDLVTILNSGNVGIGTTDPDTKLDINGAMTIRELSADPSDPDEGSFVLWMSDGTGTGDDGDILIKITAGGSTKTTTLVDFSAV